MATIEENFNAWSNYDWKYCGDEWSPTNDKTNTKDLWLGTIYPRIREFFPSDQVLELAPGYGRITQFLVEISKNLTIVDLVPKCIDSCKSRFGSKQNIKYHVNDGQSLPFISDNSIDFVISWDSMVHVERETIEAYLKEFGRILKPSGAGFIHHSNLGNLPNHPASHWRASSMSAELFTEFCDRVGLTVIRQEIIDWGGVEKLDCLSTFIRS